LWRCFSWSLVELKVLITGGAGFIGTRLARALLSDGHAVTLVDNFSPQIHGGNTSLPADLEKEVRLVRGDVRDANVWATTLPGHQAVVNLAAETGTGQSMYEVVQYEQVNISGTALLYELVAKNAGMGVERIVVASSRAIYGEGAYQCPTHGLIYPQPRSSADKKLGLFDPLCPQCDGPCASVATPETAPFQPSSFYGITKQVQEQMTLLFGKVLGIPSFALRYQNVYGPGQSLNNPYTGILAIFSNLARAGADINVFEDGLESRDFVYIDDVVRATAACLGSEVTQPYSLNVGSGERITVKQIAQAVNQFFGGRSTVSVSGAFREGDIRHGLADLSKAAEILKYHPQTAFAEGLKNFLGWAQEHEPEANAYERSLEEMKQRGLLHERT
jgi:dTDP-L-rhamnose 4-epimerase